MDRTRKTHARAQHSAAAALLLLAASGWADTTTFDGVHRNVIFLEGFGAAAMYSLNYERIFWLPAARHGLTVRVGLAYSTLREEYGSSYPGCAIPCVLMANYLFGHRPIKLEVGLGGMVMGGFYDNGNEEIIGLAVASTAAVRYQRRDGRLSLRVGLQPMLSVLDPVTLIPQPCISAGIAF